MPVIPTPTPSGTSVQTGPCTSWADETDLCEPCSDYSLDPAGLDDALRQASEILFWLSGGAYSGVCERTVRPTRQRATCQCASSCGCGLVREITLGYSPVIEILEVLLDGDVITQGADFVVTDDTGLVRVWGETPGFPCCQPISKPSTEPGTMEVTFTAGIEVPVAGIKAAAALACHLYLACHPDADGAGKCQLPRNVTSVTRQGVTWTLAAAALFAEGLTGIPEADLWLTSLREYERRRGPSVLSPELRRARVIS